MPESGQAVFTQDELVDEITRLGGGLKTYVASGGELGHGSSVIGVAFTLKGAMDLAERDVVDSPYMSFGDWGEEAETFAFVDGKCINRTVWLRWDANRVDYQKVVEFEVWP